MTGVEQDADTVTVTIKGAREGGALGRLADRRRRRTSRVREALGIPLEGFTWPERFLVASTPFDFAHVFRTCAT